VDDSDVEVLDENDDGGSGVGSADADVEEAAPVTEVVETEMPWCWARCQAMADMMAEATATRPRTGRRSARNR